MRNGITWNVPPSVTLRGPMQGKVNTAFTYWVARAYQLLVMRSPVDTGRFRGNWNVSLGKADERNNMEWTSAATTGSPATAAEITNSGVMATVDKIVKSGPQDTFLSNALPYAMKLEYGWSKQAPSPPGIVRLVAQQINHEMGGSK